MSEGNRSAHCSADTPYDAAPVAHTGGSGAHCRSGDPESLGRRLTVARAEHRADQAEYQRVRSAPMPNGSMPTSASSAPGTPGSPRRGACASAASRSSSSKRAIASAAGSGRNTRRRLAGRPRRRVARAVSRRDLRARGRGRRVHVQDVRQGRAPPRRRRPHAPLHRADPEDQPARGDHDRAGAVEDRPDGEEGSARRAVDREEGRGVGRAHGRRLTSSTAGSARASGATSSRWRCAACSPAT